MTALPITLITGLPGTGKTAMAVDLMAHGEEFKGSPFFCMGIPELKVEHEPCPPVAEWTEERKAPEDPTKSLYYFAFPPKSVVVVDEAQRVYRPRSSGSRVPPEVAAFETVRHTGVRFVLLSQDAAFLDSNVRRLVGRHIHIRVTPFGRYRYEWTGVGDPESKASREQASRARYSPPKRVFGLYKSAELHTKAKVKLPGYAYVMGLALISFIGCAAYLYNSVSGKLGNDPKSANMTAVTSGNRPQSSPVKPGTAAEYADAYKPRIAGLMHTAPAYDEVTKPVEAPIPVGCIERPRTGDCKCYDQQGNTYRTTPQVCKTILTDGLFFAWKKTPEAPLVQPPEAAPIAPQAPGRAASGGVASATTAEPIRPTPTPETAQARVPSSSPWRFNG